MIIIILAIIGISIIINITIIISSKHIYLFIFVRIILFKRYKSQIHRIWLDVSLLKNAEASGNSAVQPCFFSRLVFLTPRSFRNLELLYPR